MKKRIGAERRRSMLRRFRGGLAASAALLLLAGALGGCGKEAKSGGASSLAETGESSSGAAAPAELSPLLEGIEIKGRLKDIMERGYITMATEPYFAPYEFIDSSKPGDEQYVGADIEFAKFIAETLGVELRVVPLEFTAVLSSVPDGKYDMAVSGLAYTPERAEAMELSDGYYFNDNSKGYSLLIQEKDKDVIRSIEDLAGRTIVYQSGSLQEAISRQYIDEAACKEVKRTSSSNDAYLTVQEGKADAAVVAVESAELYAAVNPGLYIPEEIRFETPKELDGTRIGIQKGEKELLQALNACIAEVIETGQIERWMEDARGYARSLGIE